MKRKWGARAAAVALAGLGAVPAAASGGPAPWPEYIDHHGGTAAELARLYRGRLGMVMGHSPAALLYLDWRLLHDLEVGPAAGEALAPPLNPPLQDFPASAPPRYGADAWADARSLVPGAPAIPSYLPYDRPGPDYTTISNCFPDAFETAAATLRDRVARYGRAAPALRAWLLTQDAVFAACSNASAALPPAAADPPGWLRADRAYQEAAFALYNFRSADAVVRYAAIAHDHSSPWRPMAIYLAARALQREALARPSPASFARARRVLNALAATPAGTYGKGEARKMLRALAYRDRPSELIAELDRELNRREPADDLDISLRDYLGLSRTAQARPDAADWILTLQSEDRAQALAHASERWRASRDPAWLIAALSLANPGEDEAAALAGDAERVAPNQRAWVTARYHLIRLTIAGADPEVTRARLDAMLALPDLTLNERNLFSAARAQVATGLDDLARFALRQPYCAAASGTDCAEDGWAAGDAGLARRGRGFVGLGPEALAIIDRLPLADRIALSRHPALPAALRLDLALTGFARAVQLQDEAAIGRLAADLALLLPQLRGDWRTIAALPPGPARRFAESFVMAKIPGLRPDFVDYTRPRGSVPGFSGYWVDWMILPRGRTAGPASFPSPGGYRREGSWDTDEDDLTCSGECGLGEFPLHLPQFVAALQGRATAERAFLMISDVGDQGQPRVFPPGTVSLWEETLAFARAHPRDPRSPEALYRLIRVARWGGNHNHVGRRAFQLLHRRYPGSAWTRRSPYYYDYPTS